MPHTRCSESALSTLKLTAFGTSGHPSDRVCVCDDNAVAKPRDKETGLIPGCTTFVGEIDAFITEAGNDPRRATSISDASMDDCMSKFTPEHRGGDPPSFDLQ